LQRSRHEIETMREDRIRLDEDRIRLEHKMATTSAELESIIRSRTWRAIALLRKAVGLTRKPL
jgi:hypothetical protein